MYVYNLYIYITKQNDMHTVLIDYTEKRVETLNRIGQSFEIFDGKLAILTRFDREFLIEVLDSL